MSSSLAAVYSGRRDSAQPPAKQIAVIGAGASGICMAKYLLESGADVTVFEMGTKIGGLWCYDNDNGASSIYKTLHINTARNLTRFHDFDFKPGVQMFPSHEDMYEYLVDYAGHFGVTPRILFKSKVVDVRPLARAESVGPKWEVTTEDGRTRSFDAVVVANGHQWQPLHASELKERFAGEYRHSHDYKEPEPFIGKRVCVVGIGNSAVDITTDVCTIAKRTVVVARSGVMILPKTIFGIPITDIVSKLYRWWLPPTLPGRVARAITFIVHGDMKKYGFKPLQRRSHATSGALIIHHIAYNRVTVKTGIETIEGRTIRFTDGTSEEFDVLIAATGYRIEFPFISPEIVPVENNRVALYKRIVPPGWPGLYFIGLINTNTALPMIFENQARWIREFALGRAALPSRQEMEADIEARDRWLEQTYPGTARYSIETEFFPYFKELETAQREGRKRALAGRKGESSWAVR